MKLNNNLLDVEYLKQQLGGTILWTNPNPNTGFTPADINLPLNDGYDCYDVITKIGSGVDNLEMLTNRLYKNKVVVACYPFYYNGVLYVRARAYTHIQNSTTNKIVVGTGNNTGSDNNNVCIPYMIIGYKTGLFN